MDQLRVAVVDDGSLNFNTVDHLSSASIVTDSTGTVIESLDYFPFGSERVSSATTSFQSRYTFTDQEKDSETDLMYYDARFYAPSVGRFNRPDPDSGDIKDPQTLNKYAYTRNNPLKYTDPTGEFIVAAAIGLGVAAAIVDHFYDNIVRDMATAFTPLVNDARDAYEVTTGKDMISGQKLTSDEWAMTAAAATLPFIGGAQMRKGSKAAQRAEEASKKAKSRIQNIIKDLNRKGGTVGDGSTADAIINELKTGKPTKDKWHIIKGINSLRGLRKNTRILDTTDNSKLIKRSYEEQNKLRKALRNKRK